MIFAFFELLSFDLLLRLPDVKNNVCACIKESSNVCSMLAGAQIGVKALSG